MYVRIVTGRSVEPYSRKT